MSDRDWNLGKGKKKAARMPAAVAKRPAPVPDSTPPKPSPRVNDTPEDVREALLDVPDEPEAAGEGSPAPARTRKTRRKAGVPFWKKPYREYSTLEKAGALAGMLTIIVAMPFLVMGVLRSTDRTRSQEAVIILQNIADYVADYRHTQKKYPDSLVNILAPLKRSERQLSDSFPNIRAGYYPGPADLFALWEVGPNGKTGFVESDLLPVLDGTAQEVAAAELLDGDDMLFIFKVEGNLATAVYENIP
ncbi:MAG: hypothetical protein RLY93_11700 [Sumerlaeia bacterium]